MTPFQEELYRLIQDVKSETNAFTSQSEDAGNETQKIIKFAQKWDFKEKFEELRKEKDGLEQKLSKDRQQIIDGVTKTLTKELIPIIDELFAVASVAQEGSALQRGVQNQLRNLEKFLERRGGGIIKPRLGEELDPIRHQAVSAEQDPKHHGNTIVEVYRYGYFVLGKVVREAEVKVKCGVKTPV